MSHASPPAGRRPNRLAGQTSPYLLQHLYNPVDWHPWGPESLARARGEGKPIFLSIGYAACHWCHVMERESFEDGAIAAFLNEHFVPIKVDREERPDLDEIYMTSVQMMTGQGGWPLSVFLTPELKPFFGGTYFPPEDRYGRIGFLTLLRRVREAWQSRRDEIEASAGQIVEHLKTIGEAASGGEATGRVGITEAARAAAELASRFDARWGGFGGAPKFPPHGAVGLLLRSHARSGEPMALRMVETTLDRMATGGMYDQVGGGFARYSVDETWLVPHFEKMLYDQALLVPVYVEAWLVTGKSLYRRVVEETLDFVRREMTHSEGGFYASLDADSEGHEGRFYVWTPDEVEVALGREDAAFFCQVYGITPGGNFEGRSIPNLHGGDLAQQAGRMGIGEEALVARLAPLKASLLEARGRRVQPGTDDKVLTAWNGLMIGAFARTAQALGRPEDLRAAREAAGFVLSRLKRDGRLQVSWREGVASGNGFLDDYAFLARGLVDLYEADFDRRWLDEAAALARTMLERFEDREGGGFFFVSDDHEALLTRTRSVQDGALPAGSGVAAEALLRLAVHLDEGRLRQAAEAAMRALHPVAERSPSAFCALLAAADFLEGPIREIAVVGQSGEPGYEALLCAVRGRYEPNRVVAAARPGEHTDLPLLAGKDLLNGRAAAYVCRNYACDAPITDPAGIRG
jgi:uncharacterized protein